MLEINVQKQLGPLQVEVHLTLKPEPLTLVGPNGAGKTSLLLMALGILRPDHGRIQMLDRTLFDSLQKVDIATEERKMGYVPQNFALFPHLSVAENITFSLRCCRPAASQEERRDVARTWLERFGIVDLGERSPETLSTGEKQRVALARALVSKPKILLLDEPFAAQDILARRNIRKFLKDELKKLGIPTILVTHDPVEARELNFPLAVLEQGRLVQTGTREEMRTSPRSEYVREFTL